MSNGSLLSHHVYYSLLGARNLLLLEQHVLGNHRVILRHTRAGQRQDSPQSTAAQARTLCEPHLVQHELLGQQATLACCVEEPARDMTGVSRNDTRSNASTRLRSARGSPCVGRRHQLANGGRGLLTHPRSTSNSHVGTRSHGRHFVADTRRCDDGEA